MIKLILVCGPYGSGTSAVTQMLLKLGARGLKPYLTTFDDRTPTSFESVGFRNVVLSLATEDTMALLPGAAERVFDTLIEYRDGVLAPLDNPFVKQPPFVLKFPLSAVLIPQIVALFDTKLVYVLRPFEEIEASRARREWALNYGAKGAELIYSRMFTSQVNHALDPLVIHYSQLIADPASVALRLALGCGIEAPRAVIEAAGAIVSEHQGKYGKS